MIIFYQCIVESFEENTLNLSTIVTCKKSKSRSNIIIEQFCQMSMKNSPLAGSIKIYCIPYAKIRQSLEVMCGLWQ